MLPDTAWQWRVSRQSRVWELITAWLPHLWIKLCAPPTVELALCQNWLSEEWRWRWEGGLSTRSHLMPWQHRVPLRNQTSGSVFPASTAEIESERQRQLFSGHQIWAFVSGGGTKETKWTGSRIYLLIVTYCGTEQRELPDLWDKSWQWNPWVDSALSHDDATLIAAHYCENDANSLLTYSSCYLGPDIQTAGINNKPLVKLKLK